MTIQSNRRTMQGGQEGMNSPCKGCEKRTIGCHAGCELYAGWKEKMAVGAAERQRVRDGEPVFCRTALKLIWHQMKYGR